MGRRSCCKREEIWGSHEAVPDYHVSNLGRIRRRTPSVGTYVGKIMVPVLRPPSHLFVYMPPGNGDALRGRKGPRPKKLFLGLARLVIAAWGGPHPVGDWADLGWRVHHRDGNPLHNCDTNLVWRTESWHRRHHLAKKKKEEEEHNEDSHAQVRR